MAFTTRIKDVLNRGLGVADLRLETLTEVRAERARIARLTRAGHFDRPVFPVPESFQTADVSEILAALPRFEKRFESFCDPARNDVGFSFVNDYFRSPDAEVFYVVIRTQRPARIIEVGSGHSTKVARQAIIDGKLNCELISIDPRPRAEIDRLADKCIRRPVEEVDPAFFDVLGEGDILFVDSSHVLRLGNDCSFLYAAVLPRLANGVLIQIHDIFLPYDYPSDLVAVSAAAWNEQILVHAMLAFGSSFKTIWPGYFLQRTRSDFARLFPRANGARAQSLWLRR